MNSAVSFAAEQRVSRRVHSVSNLVTVAERSDFEVARQLRRLANRELKETVFSRANLSWGAFQILSGISAAGIKESHCESAVSKKKPEAHR